MFYNQLTTSDTIHKWTLAPEVGRFHIGAMTDVETVHWGGHKVSGYGQLLTPFTSGPFLQKWVCSTSVRTPMWNLDTGVETKCLAMELMCQIMFYNQLPAIKPMCQIMFYNQFPASDTIHK